MKIFVYIIIAIAVILFLGVIGPAAKDEMAKAGKKKEIEKGVETLREKISVLPEGEKRKIEERLERIGGPPKERKK